MARKRQIDPGIWTSSQFMALGPQARLLFIGLISNADDEGRLKGNPTTLRAVVFPGDGFSVKTIQSWRDEVVNQGLARLYNVNDEDYIYLPNFPKYQYISKRYPSELPTPPGESSKIVLILTDAIRQEIYTRDNHTCRYCGSNYGAGSRSLSIDHVVPATQGGATDYGNLVTCCKTCNSKKKNRTPVQAGLTLLPPSLTTVNQSAGGLTPPQHGNGIGNGNGNGIGIGNEDGGGGGNENPSGGAAPAAPNIFTLYEKNIGMLTPLIVDDLKDAEKLYPPSWIQDAFKEAVDMNKRSWRYISRILESWATEGRGSEKQPNPFKPENQPIILSEADRNLFKR